MFGTFFCITLYLCNLRQVLKVDIFLKNWGEQLQPLPPSKDTPGYDKIQSVGIYWGLSPKNPKFWGWERGYNSKKVWEHFGEGETPNFGLSWGKIPKNPQVSRMGMGLQLLKCLGTLWGWGNPKLLDSFGEKSPKIPKFWVGDGERNIGDFATTSLDIWAIIGWI